MFELLITLCLGDVCGERLLPAPMVMSQQECVVSTSTRVTNWVAAHPAHQIKDPRCVAIETLKAADVVETAPGSFVHLGLVEDVSPENAGDIANTGFIVGDDAVAVIDSGSNRVVGEALYAAIRQTTEKPIRYLLLTHMHPDHVLGAEVFKEAGATIISAPKTPQALETRAEGYVAALERLISFPVMLGTSVVLPDETVDGTREIDLGNRKLTLASHPTAHTSNDLTVVDQTARTMWMGDLVFLIHTPALDGSITGWIKLLETLQSDAVDHMIPGHGTAPVSFPDGARPTQKYLVDLARETRAAIAKGDSLNDALKYLGNGLKDDWKLFEEFNPRNATNAYVELEWE